MRNVWFILSLILMPFLAIYLAGQALWMFDPIPAYSTLGKVFQIWGFGTVAILAVRMLADSQKRDWSNLFPFTVGVLLVNVFCVMVFASDDFTTFTIAAKQYAAGQNPYIIVGQPMPFPPVAIYIYDWLHSLAVYTLTWVPTQSEDADWCIVFFLMSVWQWAAVWGMAMLTVKYAQKIGFQLEVASGATMLVLFASAPMWSAIRFDQPTATVVCVILAIILMGERHKPLQGALAAVGTLIKLYPVVLVLPWLTQWRRYWKAILWFGVTAGLAGLIEWRIGHSLLWSEWIHFLTTDSTLVNGVVEKWNNNTSGILTQLLLFAHAPETVIRIGIWTARVAIIGWFAMRYWRRKRRGGDWYGDVADALTMPLLLSPDIWEHSYLFAIPVWLYWLKLQLSRGKSPFWCMVTFVLIFALPVVRWFPWGYCRWVGVIIGMVISEPRRWYKFCG